MRKKIRFIVLEILIYIICFCIGLLPIFLVQYQSHTYLKQFAREAAGQYVAGETIESGYEAMHISVFYCTEDDIIPVQTHLAFDAEAMEEYFERTDHDYLSDINHYFLTVSMDPFCFLIVSSAPVYNGENIVGTIYLAKQIQYMPAILLTYFLVYTILYVCILFCIYVIWLNRKKVTNIYQAYIANVSHELKTPISSIQAITEILNEGLADDEVARSKYYGMIARETKQLEHSVLEIIELSKLQEHRVDFSKQSVEADTIFASLIEKYAPRCEEIDITFCMDESLKLVPTLYTNQKAVENLFSILLDNAIKFVEPGGRIEIAAVSRGSYTIFSVKDNGCGIQEKDLPHIYERFYKSQTTENGVGSGLGLSIAQVITQNLKEKLWVESEYGKGSCFFFTIKHNRK